MKAKIKSKKEVADRTLEVTYDLLGQEMDFKPGQYCFITLTANLTHHFTIVNSPTEKGIITQTTRLRDSEFKKTLQDLPIGADVEIGKWGGSFVLPESISQPVVFIALGIGITPYISMLRYMKEKSVQAEVTLLYSDSNKASMAYLDELVALQKENSWFKFVLTITKDDSWTGEKRHIDDAFIKDHIKDHTNHFYYISGPPLAVGAVKSGVEKSGVQDTNIKTENFSGY